MRVTKGRCHHCNVAYMFAGRLKDTKCPRCGSQLQATTHLFKGTWIPLNVKKTPDGWIRTDRKARKVITVKGGAGA